MLFTQCACPAAVRRLPNRRKLVLILLIVVLVIIQMWYPSQFLVNEKTDLKHTFSYTNSTDVLRRNSTVHGEVSKNMNGNDFLYKYLINEPEFCSNRSDLYIINVVGTGPWEFKARNRIRRLWANETFRNLTGFSTVFVIGISEDDDIMEEVRKESAKFRDIIQLDIIDSYINLTLKTLVLLHWVEHYCPNPSWVLKSDADVFVNTFMLSRYLRKLREVDLRSNATFLCRPRGPVSPCRMSCRHAKWRVSWEEYPHHKYPEYCMGPGYVISRELVGPLYKAANKTHPFRIEDVYYTGILPHQIKRGNHKHSIKGRFPWRPTVWQNSFVFSDLMILELDKRLGRGASSLVWSNILKNRGLIKEIDGEIQGQFKNVFFKYIPTSGN